VTTVRQILDPKGWHAWSVHPHNTVDDAVKQMANNNIGILVVLESGKLVGVITERHFGRNVFLKGRASPPTRVDEIMERDPAYVGPDQSVEDCMAIMSAKRVSHLPVISDGELLGIVSIGDLVQSIVNDKDRAIRRPERPVRPDTSAPELQHRKGRIVNSVEFLVRWLPGSKFARLPGLMLLWRAQRRLRSHTWRRRPAPRTAEPQAKVGQPTRARR